MRHGKIIIGLLTALFTAAAVLLWRLEPAPQVQTTPEENIPLSVLVTSGGETEEIRCWKDDQGQYVVFLPSYAQLAQTRFHLRQNCEIYVNQQKLKEGQTCEGVPLDEPYELTYTAAGESYEGTITFVRSGGVAAMYIDVQSGNMHYIHALKGNEESGRIRLYTPEGLREVSSNLKSISGRGNYTWTQEKKPYNLELTAQTDLLGMGQGRKWILMSNPGDPSQLRNKLVFDYARAAGLAYSPESQWVDLYLNGEYAGLYLLSERNEIHPQRVALPEDSSFLVSMELGWRMEDQGYPFVSTEAGYDLRIHHSAITETELAERWQQAENAILSDDGIDPVTGKHWQELIDLDSWARKYLIEEIFGSVDACAVSQYFYGDTQTGKLYAGPVWDYDMSMGNEEAWQLSQPEAFFASRKRLNAWSETQWFYALYQKEAFYNRVVELYREEFQPLLETYIEETLPRYALQIRTAGEGNHRRWQGRDMMKEVQQITDYMTRRMDFLNSLWLEGETYHTVLVDFNEGSNTACYAVRPGEALPQLWDTTYIPEAIGWYHRDTGLPVDGEQPVTGNLDIYLKYAESAEASQKQTSSLRSILSTVPGAVLLLILLTVIFWDRTRQKDKEKRKKEPEWTVPHN